MRLYLYLLILSFWSLSSCTSQNSQKESTNNTLQKLVPKNAVVLNASDAAQMQGAVRKENESFVRLRAGKGHLRFDQVDLERGYSKLRLIYERDSGRDGTFEVRLDSLNGPLLLSKKTLSNTGKWWPIESQVTFSIQPRKGKRTLYFIYQTNTDNMAHLRSLILFDSTTSEPKVTMQQLIDDVTQKHDVHPLPGIPPWWDYSEHARPSVHPPSKLDADFGGNKNLFNPWGHIVSITDRVPNAVVETGPLFLAILSKSKKTWQVFDRGLPTEGYSMDWVDYEHNCDISKVPECYSMGDISFVSPQGTLVAGLGIGPYNNPNRHIHFWPAQALIDYPPSDILAVASWIRARAVLRDPKGVDDRGQGPHGAHYMLSVGVDHRNENHNGPIVNSMFVGRHTKVTRAWTWFTGHTMSVETLRKYPPPVPGLRTQQ
ncbi:MAG: hypothetical protein AAGJ35_08475 [Myxococcota bacterium]